MWPPPSLTGFTQQGQDWLVNTPAPIDQAGQARDKIAKAMALQLMGKSMMNMGAGMQRGGVPTRRLPFDPYGTGLSGG